MDSTLEPLAFEENILGNEHFLLATMRNNSTTLAPVNALPPEILVRIFALLKVYCVLKRDSATDAFTRVCVYWRRVSVAAANLWAHIDIGPTIPASLTELLLDRSKNASIDIHAFEPVKYASSHGPEGHTYECTVQAMVKLLVPHLHRLRTLIVVSARVDGLTPAIFDQWSNHGCAGTPTSLSIQRPQSRGILSVQSQGETSGNLERMLLAVNTLHLDRVVLIDWASNAYRGLIDLRLEHSGLRNASISISQVFGILYSSPALHTLKLSYVEVHDPGDWAQPAPIIMGCLEVLTLTETEPAHAIPILSLITLSGLRTEVSIMVDSSSGTDIRLVKFLARSKPAILYCYRRPASSYDWKCLLQGLPLPHTLFLESFRLRPQSWLEPPVKLLDLLPPVYSVIFISCGVTLESLKELVILLETHDLCFHRCRVDDEHQNMESIQTSLLEVYSDLNCLVSDANPSKNLGCNRMFDI
ncbi:hypothetical protein FRC12_001402 [Ceratobasidium sp. 428]|nr:hypothetical protein FRC12_001402 [Ceratobasidium sp. 428]